MTQRRLRDTSVIGYSYDDLGRLAAKDLPGSEADVSYSYDLMGRATGAAQGSHGLSFVHDALGRLTSQSDPLGTIGYTYDAANRRLTMSYPGSVLTINYDYDTAGNVTKIRENGATSGVGVLATYAFDNLGRRSSVTFGNGSVQSFGYDANQRLADADQQPWRRRDDARSDADLRLQPCGADRERGAEQRRLCLGRAL